MLARGISLTMLNTSFETMAKKSKEPENVVEAEVLPAEGDSAQAKSKKSTATKTAARPETIDISESSSEDLDSSLDAVVEERSAPAPYKPADPLERYIRDMARHPLVDPEIQTEIAKKFKETGDVDLARQLVTANLRLVVKIAMEYRNSYQNVLDLIQEGNVGLLKAVKNYDPYKGTRLSYYASWWIRSYILKFLLDNFRLVKVGTTQAQKKLFYNLVREKQRLEAQGIDTNPKLLAEKLNVKEKEVVEMSHRLSSEGSEFSIDKPIGGDGDFNSTPKDFLEDGSVPVDEELALEQMKSVLQDQMEGFMDGLNEKERAVLLERLLAEDPQTLQEVANIFGISRERARQIEVRVIEKLREHMRGYIDGIPDAK